MAKKIKFERDAYLKHKAANDAKLAEIRKNIDENSAKSLENVRATIISIFCHSQALLAQFDRLNEEDHNYSMAKLGKRNYIVRQSLKSSLNKTLVELENSINREKSLFSEEHIDNHNAIVSIFEEIGSHFGVHNIEKLQAVARVLVTDDITHLIQFYQNDNK